MGEWSLLERMAREKEKKKGIQIQLTDGTGDTHNDDQILAHMYYTHYSDGHVRVWEDDLRC